MIRACLAAIALIGISGNAFAASEFNQPWKDKDKALVIDAYEYNPIDWQTMVQDRRISAFINKASDGLPATYRCRGRNDNTKLRLCRALWKRYAVARELYHTRKALAKALGLKWGAYHLGRPGNPIAQANHFLDFTQPEPDELIALDIEDNNPERWMSLEDAEIFARHIYTRTGRYPVLYTNGSTAKYIAHYRHAYPLLSRLDLWYARYKPNISRHFPLGNWKSYGIWQFATQINCRRGPCPYRPKGTPKDIDVNVVNMTREELNRAWPLGKLRPAAPQFLLASANNDNRTISMPLPQPAPRQKQGRFRVRYAAIAAMTSESNLAASYRAAGNMRPATNPFLLLASANQNEIYKPATSQSDTNHRITKLIKATKPVRTSAVARLAAQYRRAGANHFASGLPVFYTSLWPRLDLAQFTPSNSQQDAGIDLTTTASISKEVENIPAPASYQIVYGVQ